jgi:hypothetical protein
MTTFIKTVSGAVLATGLALSPAFAQGADTPASGVTALITVKANKSGDHTQSYRVDNLQDAESCLYLGWADSMSSDTDHYWGNQTIVKCIEKGRVIAGQACFEGTCKPFAPPAIKP